MSNRFENANRVVLGISEANPAWNREMFAVPGAVSDWAYKMPRVPVVSDGSTPSGRGTTAFDLVRKVESGSIVRFDWLSVKTATIGADKKLPSKITLSTGTPETHEALISAYLGGTALPTIVFASRKGESHGKVLMLDLAEPIRRFGVVPISDYPENGFPRGSAPPVYYKWSSARPSGIKRADTLRAMGVPDDGSSALIKGCLWTSDSVCYPELIVSLYAIGVSRNTWIDANVSDLAGLLDHPVHGFDWEGF